MQQEEQMRLHTLFLTGALIATAIPLSASFGATGWGWSWFDATNPQKTTSTDYTTDCQSCHVPARQSDWIYTHGYPVLTR